MAFAIKPRTVEKHVTLATSMLNEMMSADFPPDSQSLSSEGRDSTAVLPDIHRPVIYPRPLEAPTPGYRVQRIRGEESSKLS